MFNTIFTKGSIPVAEQVLYFTARRHDALANNVANAETPMYKATDAPVADFEEAMDRAIARRDRRRIPVFSFEGYGGVSLRPGGGHILDYVETSPRGKMPDAGMLKHIENNVDVDIEMGKLVKNAILHNTVASVLTQQFSMLRAAISERVA